MRAFCGAYLEESEGAAAESIVGFEAKSSVLCKDVNLVTRPAPPPHSLSDTPPSRAHLPHPKQSMPLPGRMLCLEPVAQPCQVLAIRLTRARVTGCGGSSF